ncbi:DUF2637 domain-containing protein [Streptomyces sp. DSM 41987]|uniref:DUF2637 domain-containing protein n=1 Tax=Streptomyces TaxID=1883 RepID=UPI0018DF0B05|nr:DUF2637 domain-containing protein [Streptomyces fildesensis]
MTTVPEPLRLPSLSRFERALLVGAIVLGVGVGGTGFAVSFGTVTAAAVRWGFTPPQMLPIGIDTAIPVFSIVNLLLIRMDMPLAWVRFVPWFLTGVTCWLNIAAGHSLSAKIAHGTMPLLWVALSEVAAHVYAARIGAVTGRRMEKIRRSRWLLAFPSTFALWRRMTLWEITSYAVALDLERDRLLARADLREEHGLLWRYKTSRRSRVLLKFGELTPAPTTSDANQEEYAVTIGNQSMSDLPVSTPEADTPQPSYPALEAADPHPTADPIEPVTVQPTMAAAQSKRRATGRVPAAARNPRPTRTPDQLLTEAREATAGWSDAELTAEAIRKELRTAPAKARVVRDALKAERVLVHAP